MILQINKNRLIESFSMKIGDFDENSENLIDDMFSCKSFSEFESRYPNSYKLYRSHYADLITIEEDMTFEDIACEVLVEVALNDDDFEDFEEDYDD